MDETWGNHIVYVEPVLARTLLGCSARSPVLLFVSANKCHVRHVHADSTFGGFFCFFPEVLSLCDPLWSFVPGSADFWQEMLSLNDWQWQPLNLQKSEALGEDWRRLCLGSESWRVPLYKRFCRGLLKFKRFSTLTSSSPSRLWNQAPSTQFTHPALLRSPWFHSKQEDWEMPPRHGHSTTLFETWPWPLQEIIPRFPQSTDEHRLCSHCKGWLFRYLFLVATQWLK